MPQRLLHPLLAPAPAAAAELVLSPPHASSPTGTHHSPSSIQACTSASQSTLPLIASAAGGGTSVAKTVASPLLGSGEPTTAGR